jgi:uncharacterized protein (TIGR00255 family)
VQSMTGYASKTVDLQDYTLTVEMKSLNNKFLELRFKLPPVLDHLEERFRRILRQFVQRGKVDVFMKLAAKEDRELRSVTRMIGRYYGFMEKIREETGYGLQPTLSEIIALKNLINPFEDVGYTDIADELVEEVFTATVRIFQDSRVVEGEHAQRDIRTYIDAISASLGRVERLSPAVCERYREQLKDKIRELVDGKLDETRVMMEAGIFASRVDVSEEISRLSGHIGKFLLTAEAAGACGRELDFIVQEMGREVNTMGSKVPDYAVAEEVVSMKSNLEKIREQVRNVE